MEEGELIATNGKHADEKPQEQAPASDKPRDRKGGSPTREKSRERKVSPPREKERQQSPSRNRSPPPHMRRVPSSETVRQNSGVQDFYYA